MLPPKRCYTKKYTQVLRRRSDWVGQNPHRMSVQLKVMCLFQLTHLQQQKNNWGKSSTNTLYQTAAKQANRTKELQSNVNMWSFRHCLWESLSRKPNTLKQSCWQTHTHTKKHNGVPFLLARSSFRGLSKNMASEEDAFKKTRKIKQP